MLKSAVQSKIDTLKAILSSGSETEIEKAAEELSLEIQKIGGAMYNKRDANEQ